MKNKIKNSHNKKLKACMSKKKYKTKEEAQSRANNLYKKNINLKPYKCDICGGYHLCKVDWQTSLNKAFKQAGLKAVFHR